jgi:hypothetical protein
VRSIRRAISKRMIERGISTCPMPTYTIQFYFVLVGGTYFVSANTPAAHETLV